MLEHNLYNQLSWSLANPGVNLAAGCPPVDQPRRDPGRDRGPEKVHKDVLADPPSHMPIQMASEDLTTPSNPVHQARYLSRVVQSILLAHTPHHTVKLQDILHSEPCKGAKVACTIHQQGTSRLICLVKGIVPMIAPLEVTTIDLPLLQYNLLEGINLVKGIPTPLHLHLKIKHLLHQVLKESVCTGDQLRCQGRNFATMLKNTEDVDWANLRVKLLRGGGNLDQGLVLYNLYECPRCQRIGFNDFFQIMRELTNRIHKLHQNLVEGISVDETNIASQPLEMPEI